MVGRDEPSLAKLELVFEYLCGDIHFAQVYDCDDNTQCYDQGITCSWMFGGPGEDYPFYFHPPLWDDSTRPSSIRVRITQHVLYDLDIAISNECIEQVNEHIFSEINDFFASLELPGWEDGCFDFETGSDFCLGGLKKLTQMMVC